MTLLPLQRFLPDLRDARVFDVRASDHLPVLGVLVGHEESCEPSAPGKASKGVDEK